MEKVLDQQQIDAMVRAARGNPDSASPSEAAVVSRWDARQAGQIGKQQAQAISALHEGFARSLTHSVGAYLRVAFTAALVSAEHLTYGEFLQRIPEVTYLASCKLAPVDALALVQLDLAVAFPLIDVLLGGEGKSALPQRQITAIEEHILETVMRILCRELQAAWQILSLEFAFEQRQQPEQVQHLMPAEEKTLSLSFELTVAESRGTLSLVFPAVVSNALLRKMSADWIRPRRRPQPEESERLRLQLLQCPFRMALGLTVPHLPLRQLLDLSPGTVLSLPCLVPHPATLHVGERKLFSAVPARRGAARAAQIVEPCRRAAERNVSS